MHGQIRTDSNSVLKVCANRFSSNKRMNWFIFSFTVTQNDVHSFFVRNFGQVLTKKLHISSPESVIRAS